MKKKAIAVILYLALLLTSVFPASAMAENEAAEGTGTPTETLACT